MKKPYNLNIFLPFSTSLKGWRKWFIVFLGRIGKSWRFSPIRRIIQTISLLLFLYLFFYVAWPYDKVFSNEILSDKESIPVEIFLWLDPLVGTTASIAGRCWNTALLGTLAVFLFCIFFPRGFCGYICPLGTLLDCFDWLIGRHFKHLNFKHIGWWIYLKYYLLMVVIIASVFGVLLTGYLSAMPVLNRGWQFTAGRLQLVIMKSWGYLEPVTWTFYLSIALFIAIFLLSFLRNRFWCNYICPSGALFSLFSLFRINERKVESTCINCGKCKENCSFDAIKDNFTTRHLNCTFCQTCGGVCPKHAIKFVSRWNSDSIKIESLPNVESGISRRGFIISGISGIAIAISIKTIPQSKNIFIRPPGSLSEPQFVARCVRCGECIKVCPGPVLSPAGLEGGMKSLWTPKAVLSHAGCHQDCNFCTQVCPTGAIQPLSISEKRRTRMGLAVIDVKTCLPHRGERDCSLCFEECKSAGYNAIQMRQIKLNVGDIPAEAMPGFGLDALEASIEIGRIEAPFVDRNACVGCGLCEYRCHKTYVKHEKIFSRSAIIIVPENGDRKLI